MKAGNIKLNVLIFRNLSLVSRNIISVMIAITVLTLILDNIVITMIFQLYVDLYLLMAMIIFQGIVCQLEW